MKATITYRLEREGKEDSVAVTEVKMIRGKSGEDIVKIHQTGHDYMLRQLVEAMVKQELIEKPT